MHPPPCHGQAEIAYEVARAAQQRPCNTARTACRARHNITTAAAAATARNNAPPTRHPSDKSHHTKTPRRPPPQKANAADAKCVASRGGTVVPVA